MNDWLASTYRLQAEAYGIRLPFDEGEDLADYASWNLLALHAEVDEVGREVGWKPWSSRRGQLNREAYLEELIDVAHFVANLACAVGCTDEEWEKMYRAKQDVNRRRQREGY